MRCDMTRHQSNRHCNVRAVIHKVKCDCSVQRKVVRDVILVLGTLLDKQYYQKYYSREYIMVLHVYLFFDFI